MKRVISMSLLSLALWSPLGAHSAIVFHGDLNEDSGFYDPSSPTTSFRGFYVPTSQWANTTRPTLEMGVFTFDRDNLYPVRARHRTPDSTLPGGWYLINIVPVIASHAVDGESVIAGSIDGNYNSLSLSIRSLSIEPTLSNLDVSIQSNRNTYQMSFASVLEEGPRWFPDLDFSTSADGEYFTGFSFRSQESEVVINGMAVRNLAPTPAVPEPSTYAMTFAGLALVGWLARRRRTPQDEKAHPALALN